MSEGLPLPGRGQYELKEPHRSHLWQLLVSFAAEYFLTTEQFAEMMRCEITSWEMLTDAFAKEIANEH